MARPSKKISSSCEWILNTKSDKMREIGLKRKVDSIFVRDVPSSAYVQESRCEVSYRLEVRLKCIRSSKHKSPTVRLAVVQFNSQLLGTSSKVEPHDSHGRLLHSHH
jgi:hypothetical protein